MIFFAIPFFKNTKFLEETLRSLLRQTSSNWQAIVLDDSVDPNESLNAERLVTKLNYPQIKYRKNKQNIGMANNWNQGMKLGKETPGAQATVILHADDRLMPEYVLSMERALASFPDTTAFFCKAAVIDEFGKRAFSFTDFYKLFLLPKMENGIITLNGVEGVGKLIPGNFIFCPTLCFRNSKLDRLFEPELKMVADFEFILSYLMQGHVFKGIYSRTLFEYRRHSSNTTQILNQNLERFKEEKNLYLQLSNQLINKNCYQLSKKAKNMQIVKKNLLFLTLSSLLRGKFSLMNRYLQFLLKL